jgi:hypothetical protein
LDQVADLVEPIQKLFSDRIVRSERSGFAVLFMSRFSVYKVRGLDAPLIFDRSPREVQALTHREWARSKAFGSHGTVKRHRTLRLETNSYVVLSMARVEPFSVTRLRSLTIDEAVSVAREALQIDHDYRRVPLRRYPQEFDPAAGLTDLLDQLDSTLPSLVSHVLRGVAGTSHSLRAGDRRYSFHGDLRFPNLGTLGGQLKVFDPAVLPDLFLTTPEREWAALWGSYISAVQLVPSLAMMSSSITNSSHFDVANALEWIQFHIAHRFLLDLKIRRSRDDDLWMDMTSPSPGTLVELIEGVRGLA